MNKQIHGEISIVNLPGTGSLLHRTWVLYKELFPKLAHMTALISLGGLVNLSLSSFAEYSLRATPTLQAVAQVIVAGIVIVSALYYAFIFSGIISLVHGWVQGKKMTVATALDQGMRHYKSVFWVLMLGILIVDATRIALYPLPMIALAVVFTVWYYLSVYIVILEDVRGIEALARSRYLMHGMFFKCLGRSIIGPSFIMIVMVLSLPLLFIPALGWMAYLIVNVVCLFFGGPFFIVYEYLRYHDLVAIDRNIPFYYFPGERRSIITWSCIGGFILIAGWIFGLFSPSAQNAFMQTALRSVMNPPAIFSTALTTNTDQLVNFFNIFSTPTDTKASQE